MPVENENCTQNCRAEGDAEQPKPKHRRASQSIVIPALGGPHRDETQRWRFLPHTHASLCLSLPLVNLSARPCLNSQLSTHTPPVHAVSIFYSLSLVAIPLPSIVHSLCINNTGIIALSSIPAIQPTRMQGRAQHILAPTLSALHILLRRVSSTKSAIFRPHFT